MSFQNVIGQRPKRAKFNLSHEKKLSMQMGKIYPVMLEEVVPGDQFDIKSEVMIRFAPMLAPIMHRIDAYIHYFFVPNRIVWDDWENFITGEETLLIPQLTLNNEDITIGSLYDYMGLPTHNDELAGTTEVNALPFRAYAAIFHEYYRDQNLIPAWDFKDDAYTPTVPYKRAWERDYYTSSLPFAQKGDPATIPIDHDVNYKNTSTVLYSNGAGITSESLNAIGSELVAGHGTGYARVENIDSIEASISINEIRESNAIQRWLEKNARAGTRYIETILAHFGVVSDDARLQRPEYLGGGKTAVVISEVVNSTGFTDDEANALPQGALAGHGLSIGAGNFAKCYAKEHGYIFGLLSVMPRTNYFQGMHRKFTRKTPYDFYWPSFANLGEQEVTRGEVYFSAVPSEDEKTFGYQGRYEEYRKSLSTIHGDFRDTLKFWHMAREFNQTQELDAGFIQCDPTDRVFAVNDGSDNLWCQVYHQVYAKRPMPKYNTPKL